MTELSRLQELHKWGEVQSSYELISHYYRCSDLDSMFNVLDYYAEYFYPSWSILAKYVWEKREEILAKIDQDFPDLIGITRRNIFGYYFFYHLSRARNRRIDVDFLIDVVQARPNILSSQSEILEKYRDTLKVSQKKFGLKYFKYLRKKLINYPVIPFGSIMFPPFQWSVLPQALIPNLFGQIREGISTELNFLEDTLFLQAILDSDKE